MENIESVTVTGMAEISGIMKPITVPKERSTITQDFINTQPAGQSVFESLNKVPGFNFTNNDPYGNSGGDIRIHGFDGNHISFTWDGMPLNDTGNYAIFTNQIMDSEIIATASVNQGTTDVDSPTAAATGGVVALTTIKPGRPMGRDERHQLRHQQLQARIPAHRYRRIRALAHHRLRHRLLHQL